MKNKRNILAVVGILSLLCAYYFGFYKHETSTNTNNLVGNDRDSHGCIASAGYTYSSLRNECIRIFETGVSMDPKAPELDKSMGAFVVLAKENQETENAEIYVPTDMKAIALKPVKDNGAGTWSNEKYTLRQWKGVYTLEDSTGRLLYQGSVLK
jgi:hypothetical protein